VSTLLRQVGEEIGLLLVFVDLLEREAEALADHRFELLPDLTRSKDKTAERLAACDAEREQLLVTLGYAADGAGADAAAARGGPALQQAWTRLLALAARARDLNHRNGVLVHAHLDFTRQSIAFLRTGSRPLYGPDGQHSAGRGQGVRYAAG
jgi:flagella synthesis protein FlgN